MKLITLNTWGGRAGLPVLKDFFRKYQDTHVFCLQEIWQAKDPSLLEGWDARIVPDLLEQIGTFLPSHRWFFRPQYREIYGLATFVRLDLDVEDEGERFVFRDRGYENPSAIGNHARNFQYVTLGARGDSLTIVNFHGLWNGTGKSDTDDRILQSQKIASFLKSRPGPRVLAGDFNLMPDTHSFRLLTETCPRDFIREHGIRSTRSSHYPKPEKFADYVLASLDVRATSFEVLTDEVSDHLALSIEIDFPVRRSE